MNKNKVLIFPNGYGSLEYIKSLEVKIESLKLNVSTICIDSVNEVKHNYNHKTIREYLPNLLKNEITNSQSKNINIIAHCSSLTYFTELLETDFNEWDRIEKIILYSYLANPIKHYNRFIKKAQKKNITITERKNFLNKYSNPKIYENIPVPIEVIHSHTLMNKFRASDDELNKFLKNKNVISIEKPLHGYEILDLPQDEEIEYIFNNFIENKL